MVSNGVGLVIGQGIAGVLGPVLGWRIPFAIVGANCVFFACERCPALHSRDPPLRPRLSS